MYLALFMTSESETALRHFAPDAPKNLHLTVVHVKGVRPVEAILYHEPSLPVECICLELDELGPRRRRFQVFDHDRLGAAGADHGQRVARRAALRVVVDRDRHTRASRISVLASFLASNDMALHHSFAAQHGKTHAVQRFAALQLRDAAVDNSWTLRHCAYPPVRRAANLAS